MAQAGFKPSSHQIAIFDHQPSEAEADDVRATCVRLQDELRQFGHERPKTFSGTVRALISCYQTDPDSRYQAMRYKTRLHTDSMLKRLDDRYGKLKLADLGARDFKRWYEETRWPDGKDGREIITTAHAFMTVVRMMFSYGTVFEIDPQCARLKAILSEMTFENGKPRTEAMTFRQCEDIIAAAHAAELHSIALIQAMQFDLRARQRDIIGEWVPQGEPGISVIPIYHGKKWLRGIRWEEISSTMKLSHPISKSRTGKMLKRDLSLYPMIMAELNRIPAEKRTGPVAICDITGRPWKQNHFRIKWREVATAAGVPPTVFNMDSRAGGITETIEATGGNIEAARKEAEHSDIKTTMGYSRRKAEAVMENAAHVLEFRGKNRS